MRTHRRGLLLALAGLLASAPFTTTRATDIAFRAFSGSIAMGPQAVDFGNKLAALTALTLGEAGTVRFTKLAGTPAIPAQFGGDIMKAVAAGAAGGGFDAAYQSGGEMNATWGFLYNSGTPFGPTFDEYMGFLYSKSVNDGSLTGLELLQATLDASSANVVAIPIVAGTEQGSGYFPQPVGPAPGTWGIGLAGLCQAGWTFRYLPPAQNVLDRACDNLVKRHVIQEKKIAFIAAVPGGGSLVSALRSGQIQAFEFASPWDDVSQLFNTADNPGLAGARYLHFPGWHQQWFLSYALINKQVWDGLSAAQQALFKTAARDHVLSAYAENLRQDGPALHYIMDVNKADADPSNDMVLVKWPDHDLALLRDAAIQFMNERLVDPALPAADRAAYGTILEAIRKYVQANDLYWDRRALDEQMRFRGWKSPTGEPWGERNGPSWWDCER